MPVALGTLVESQGSAPAPIGTTVALDASGNIAGNIGAGCYEGEIVEACMQTLADGQFRLVRINLTDTDEIAGGSGCGGALKIAIWKPGPLFAREAREIATGADDCAIILEQGIQFVIPAKRRIVVVGATTLAQSIAKLAKSLDFFVTVVDPRPLFATPERIPDADRLVTDWPDDYLPGALLKSSALIVVSHDPKFDIPALRCGLSSNVPYIGLLGSRRSQAARREALRDNFDDSQLARIHGPVGLDLGGRTPGETALSILAQIVALSHARPGGDLERATGSIHAVTP